MNTKISKYALSLILFSHTFSSYTLAFCPEGKNLHPFNEAGYACYKEEEGIICDSNDDADSLCTKNNCEIQFGGYDMYNCAVASFHYDAVGYGEHLKDKWMEKCCFEETAAVAGCLGGEALQTLTFSGECSYNSFYATATDFGCNEIELYAYLQVGNEAEARSVFEELCYNATEYAHNSFYEFSDIANAGYQFDREFMNGGSEWNNALKPDLSRIQYVEDNVHKGITFPTYLTNFESCDSKAVMCCWTSDSTDAGLGSCEDSAGCFDAEPDKNTDVCYVDITDSPKASHTEAGKILYPGESEGSTNCMGFTWTDDEDNTSTLYKGNLLFEIAMKYGLKDNGYTRSVPHAPMCSCVEQMPVVSRADCMDATVTDNWSFTPDPDSGLLTLYQSSVDLVYNDCNGDDLATHYSNVHGSSISDRLVGDCEEPVASFAATGFSKEDPVKWVKVAGKGAYAEHDNPTHTDNDVHHSSMSREDFEELWKNSNKILLRRCKYCTMTHRYIYYKRYDTDGELPGNVDLLNVVKKYWHQFENNYHQQDWNLFSTYENAVNDINPWEWINGNDQWVGFPRDSGPKYRVNSNWNTWGDEKMHGQSNVAFYVAMPSSITTD